jgi:hypothetical protein
MRMEIGCVTAAPGVGDAPVVEDFESDASHKVALLDGSQDDELGLKLFNQKRAPL